MTLNAPDNTPKGVFVDAFGRKHSAPTVCGNVIFLLSLTEVQSVSYSGWVLIERDGECFLEFFSDEPVTVIIHSIDIFR